MVVSFLPRVSFLLLTLAVSGCTVADEPSTTEPLLATSGKGKELTARGRALDGDTVSIDVRLLGADAVESRQMCRNADGCWTCGKAAQDLAARLLKQGPATFRLTGKQSYGRPVGTITVGDEDLGEMMIRAGMAVPAVEYLKRDETRASRYLSAYDDAMKARRGIHAGPFIDPSRWRRGERLSCEGKVGARRSSDRSHSW